MATTNYNQYGQPTNIGTVATQINDYDRANAVEGIYHRRCSCGNDMVIKLGLDENNNPAEIGCQQGCVLRYGGADFAMGYYPGDRYGKYIYCSKCKGRRAWRLFKDITE
jgi:hypothetical protein